MLFYFLRNSYGKLLVCPKRNDKEFTNEQLKHHLIECLELLNAGDNHLYAELIDMVQIIHIYLRQNLDVSEIQEITEKRYNKFIQKLNQDNT